MRRTHAVLLALLAAAVVVALVVPLPSPLLLRDWAHGAGPLAPLLFLVAHAVVTTTPVPRTAFTLAAGLMFGPWWGLGLCVAASTLSALAAFALARRLGGRVVRHLGPGRVRRLEERLARRGLLTVTSARLVPAVPFAPLNYTLGVTGVNWGPFALGTVVGLVPGTAAVVLLGDAVAGGVTPLMVVMFAVSGSVGLAGFLVAARDERRGDPDDGPAPTPAE